MQLTKLKGIVSALNPGAEVVSCEYGKVDLRVGVGSERESWIAHGDDEDDFRVAVKAAKAAAAESCQDPACTDESHAHSHGKAEATSHGHAHTHDSACSDAECSDESHAHSHGHVETESHSHSHSDGHTHTHSEKERETVRAGMSPEEKFGISSFVYSRSLPP